MKTSNFRLETRTLTPISLLLRMRRTRRGDEMKEARPAIVRRSS